MLPGFIIDQIRQREEEEQAQPTRPQLELPIPAREGAPPQEREEDAERGVVIIDLMGL
ncbi:MAG: hypothetical protein AAF436_10365 [Myxococcota bacterium]